MKKIFIIIFQLLLISFTFARDPICPQEDYFNIPYQSKEDDGVTDLSITICFDSMSDPLCQDCCITVYYFKRLIPPQNGMPQRVDIMLDYISQTQTEDCYWCNRIYADEIIELIHKKILEKHADEYGLKGKTWNYNHLIMRAGCVKEQYHNYLVYDEICEIDIEACCFKTVRFTMNDDGKVTEYIAEGQNLYSWPPNFECPPNCHKKYGLLAGLNLYTTHPKISLEREVDFNKIFFDMSNNEMIIKNNVRGNISIDIYNYSGKLVKSVTLLKSGFEIKFSCKDLEKGVYFYRIGNKEKIIYNKFIKVR